MVVNNSHCACPTKRGLHTQMITTTTTTRKIIIIISELRKSNLNLT